MGRPCLSEQRGDGAQQRRQSKTAVQQTAVYGFSIMTLSTNYRLSYNLYPACWASL